MTEQEQLPVCVLCGEEPEYYGLLVGCSKPCCDLRAALMSASDWRRLMAPPYEAIDGSDVVTIAVPASSIPAGATLRECYETDSEVIVIGAPYPDDENHNCDAMGCGSCGHVLYRFPKSRPRLAPEHVKELRGLMRCGYVSTEETAAIRAALAALGEE